MEKPKLSLDQDALVAPDNSYGGSDEGDMYGANTGIDMTAQLERQMNPDNEDPGDEQEQVAAVPESTNEYEEDDGHRDLTQDMLNGMDKKEEVNTNNEASDDSYTVRDLLTDAFRNKFGNEYNLPEDVNDDNWFDKTVEIIQSGLQNDDNQHPLAKEIAQATANNIDVEAVIKAYVDTKHSYSTMDDRTLVTNELKQIFGNKWSDEKLTSVVSNMEKSGTLEIEAEKIRMVADQRSQEKARSVSQSQMIEKQRAQAEFAKQVDTRINDVMSQFDKYDNLYGLPIGKADKLEFLREFPSMVKPDPKTGMSWMEKQLQSDENAIKIAYLLKYGDGFGKSALTRAKEQAKGSVMDRLDAEPRFQRKAEGEFQDPLTIDYDALAKPEKIYIKR